MLAPRKSHFTGEITVVRSGSCLESVTLWSNLPFQLATCDKEAGGFTTPRRHQPLQVRLHQHPFVHLPLPQAQTAECLTNRDQGGPWWEPDETEFSSSICCVPLEGIYYSHSNTIASGIGSSFGPDVSRESLGEFPWWACVQQLLHFSHLCHSYECLDRKAV